MPTNPVQISVGHTGIDARLLELFLFLGSKWVLYLLMA